MTDVLIWQENGGLTNVVQDRFTGLTSAVYPYMQLAPQDIDGDGCIEIPAPEQPAKADTANTAGGQGTGKMDFLRQRRRQREPDRNVSRSGRRVVFPPAGRMGRRDHLHHRRQRRV